MDYRGGGGIREVSVVIGGWIRDISVVIGGWGLERVLCTTVYVRVSMAVRTIPLTCVSVLYPSVPPHLCKCSCTPACPLTCVSVPVPQCATPSQTSGLRLIYGKGG